MVESGPSILHSVTDYSDYFLFLNYFVEFETSNAIKFICVYYYSTLYKFNCEFNILEFERVRSDIR